MTPEFAEWTITLVGHWNVRIFSPEWVATNLFEVPEVQAEVAIGPELGPIRYIWGNVVLVPSPHQLIVGMRDSERLTLEKASSVATNLLALLPHTPIRAFGINFGFIEENPSDDLVKLFQLSDSAKLSDMHCDILKTELHRAVQIDGKLLNLLLGLDNGKLSVRLNYHFNVTGAIDAKDKLFSNAVVLLKSQSDSFLSQTYGLTLENNDEE